MKAKASKSAAKTQLQTAPGTAVAPVRFELPQGFRPVRAVTLPAIVMKTEGETRILRIHEAMRLSSAAAAKPGKDGAKKPDMEPATVCAVVDAQTGEMGTFVVPAVVRENLNEKYPSDSYVGLFFQITNKGKRAGKRYYDFEVMEVAPAD